MTRIFAIFGPKSGKNRIFFARDFGARDRLLSLLGGGHAHKKAFLRVCV